VHARANHDVVPLVQEDGDVVRVEPIDREGVNARARPRVGGTEHVDARLVRERRGHTGVHRVLLSLDLVEPHAREILETRVGADHARVVLKPRLEPVGRRSEGVSFQCGPLDGLAPEH
jgi:hypothetical protein